MPKTSASSPNAARWISFPLFTWYIIYPLFPKRNHSVDEGPQSSSCVGISWWAISPLCTETSLFSATKCDTVLFLLDSVTGLLRREFLLKNLLWGLRDPFWLCIDCSCTDVGGLGDKSDLPSHQACQYFLSTWSVQGRKYSSAFRRSVSKSESIICQIFPVSGTRTDPMESF